jgi:ABC-2 type transport system permease protein
MKLWATIKKDIRILLRDKVGISLMFGMPIILVIVVTGIQRNTFELLNKNKVPLLLCNKDTGAAGRQFIAAIDKIGMFKLQQVSKEETVAQIKTYMNKNDVLIGMLIPANFSVQVEAKAKNISGKALKSFGLEADSLKVGADNVDPVTLYYNPVLQESFKLSMKGAIGSALQMVESRQVLKSLYFSINEKPLPDTLENEMLNDRISINEISLSSNGNNYVPTVSQHNVPAWTIFAMFFVVLSLGGSIVREKLSGSFIRLKTLPTNYLVALFSKQITYLFVTLLQAMVIFAIGVWLFPFFGLPALQLPADILGLLLVTLICGWCAVSYAICIGVFAQTQEQANGFGAISIVIFAVIGGLMVPAFAMPDTFKTIMKISPLHWCLEAYYGLFLEGGKLKDVLINIIPLLAITVLLQLFIFVGLKRKNLI